MSFMMMKYVLTTCFLFFVIAISTAQAQESIDIGIERDIEQSQQGKMYVYWGWNRAGFTNSDITFTGEDYDFELKDVVAHDRQSKFAIDPYFKFSKFTIPQYNFRIGYFFKNNWDISIGTDHMKYVMDADQEVSISGNISNSFTSFDDVYIDGKIKLTTDFLKFEHTDGLNFVNTEIRHSNRVVYSKTINIDLLQGLGVGFLLPKTNTTLLGKDRYDEFHLSGFGLSGLVGAKIMFWNRFFVQAELKGGYINMPNIRTTNSESDSASQQFFYAQRNIIFGWSFRVWEKIMKAFYLFGFTLFSYQYLIFLLVELDCAMIFRIVSIFEKNKP